MLSLLTQHIRKTRGNRIACNLQEICLFVRSTGFRFFTNKANQSIVRYLISISCFTNIAVQNYVNKTLLFTLRKVAPLLNVLSIDSIFKEDKRKRNLVVTC